MKTYWRENQFIARVGVIEIVLATVFGDSALIVHIENLKKPQPSRTFWSIEEARKFVEDEFGIPRWCGNKYVRGNTVLAEYTSSKYLESYFDVTIRGVAKQPSRVFFTKEDAINFIEKQVE